MWAITLLATSSGMHQHWGSHIRCIDGRVGESTKGQVYQRGVGVSTKGRAYQQRGGRINKRAGVSAGGGRINRRQMYTGGMGVLIAGQHVAR